MGSGLREGAGRFAVDADALGMVVGALLGAVALAWFGLLGLVGGWAVGGLVGAELAPFLRPGRRYERPTVGGRAVRLAGSLAVGSAVLLTTNAFEVSDLRVLTAGFVLASALALWLLLDCQRPTRAVRVVVPAWGGVLLVALFVSFLATGLGASAGAGPGNESASVAARDAGGESDGPGTTAPTTVAVVEEPAMVANESEEEYAEETAAPSDDEYRPGGAGVQVRSATTTSDAPYPGTGGLPAPLRDPGVLAVMGVVAVLVGTIPRFRRG